MTYVYLYKNENEKPFYVGIGTGYRAWSHLKPSSYMPYDVEYPSFYGQIKKMKQSNITPKIEIIFEGDRKDCEKLEGELISRYGIISEGGQLYNITKNTGGRVKGKKYPMSENTAKRYKQTRKENRKFVMDESMLRLMYIDQNMTRKRISETFGCSEALVKARLKEYNIKRQKV
jgi:hypothetical protein